MLFIYVTVFSCVEGVNLAQYSMSDRYNDLLCFFGINFNWYLRKNRYAENKYKITPPFEQFQINVRNCTKNIIKRGINWSRKNIDILLCKFSFC